MEQAAASSKSLLKLDMLVIGEPFAAIAALDNAS
jgi:hypothetical protein